MSPATPRKAAPAGSIARPQYLRHTEESLAALKALSTLWGEPNATEVVRRALRECAAAAAARPREQGGPA